MKLSLAIGLSLIATVAFADSTTTITVEGMHCSGCKEMVKAKVCGNEEIAKNAASCDVQLTNEKKQIGQVTIVSKAETAVDVELVKKQVAAAGTEYKVTKVDHTVENVKVATTTEATGDKTMTTTTTTATQTVTSAKNGKTNVVKKVKMNKKTQKADAAADATVNATTTTETKTEVKKETK
jgi:hypothetical protein